MRTSCTALALCSSFVLLAAPVWAQAQTATPTAAAAAEPAAATDATPAAEAAPAAEPEATAPAAEPEAAPAEEPKEELTPIEHKVNLQVPEAPPSEVRTYRVHRGFYLGVNAGIGYNSGAYDDNHSSDQDLDAEGFNLVADVLVGYSSSPGLAVGGALMLDLLPSASFERNGTTQDEASMSLLLGPFVDGFPNDRGPFHIGGTLGLAHVRAPKVAFDGSDVNATGLGFGAWVGWVPWVSEHFSIGASLRLMANFTGFGADKAARTHSMNLVLNALHF